ncbi:hypothetical protein K1719_014584 [Acacia pycnantha]|nr:hypothetical protein K1719_014584 [Acacia pycnantha]
MAIPSTVSNSIPMAGNEHVKEEHDPLALTSVSLQSISSQKFPMKPVKGEQDDLTNGQLALVVSSVSSAHGDDNRAARIAKSVNELGNLSVAINTFMSRYDELQKHLEFIDKAIDTRSKELSLPSNATPNTATVSSTPLAGGNVLSTEPVSAQPTPVKEDELHSNPKLNDGPLNEVFSLCRTMCSRGLRKYIISNLSQPEKLREEVPVALKSAPKPSRLVLECIGRFFLQGSRAYIRDSPMIPARLASVLVLEYYLLSGCAVDEKNIYPSSKEEASLAACAWKKRLIVEGGVSKACEIDARGLILFVGCFGIPVSFRHEEIQDLIRLSNPREIMHALRQSRGLVKRVSDITDGLMRKGNKSEDSWKKTKQDTRGSATALKQADEKYLAALRSTLNCLEGHKIDHTQFLPGSKLKEKISSLEKDIDDANRKIQVKVASKRKMDKNESSNKFKAPESKRLRSNLNDPSLISSPGSFLQEHRIGALPESVFGATLETGGGKLIGAGIGVTTGSLSGYHEDTVVDHVGTMLNNNDHLYRRLGIRESVLSLERSVGQPASARLCSLYGVSPSLESFAGFPDHPSLGSTSHIAGADLYSFADSIYETDSLKSSSSTKATNGSSSSYILGSLLRMIFVHANPLTAGGCCHKIQTNQK